MTPRTESAAPAMLLLAFGLAPWLDVGLFAAAYALRDILGSPDRDLALKAMLGSVGVGAAGAVLAFVVGTVAVILARRDARARRCAGDAPLRARRGPRRSTLIARSAALVAVVGLWGPGGALMLAAAQNESGWRVALLAVAATVGATALGAVRLVRSRRRSAGRPGT